MEGMIKYIFGELQDYKSCVNQIMRKQVSFSRSVAFFAIATMSLSILHQIRINSQEDKIKLLYREIQKLKESNDSDTEG